MPESRCWLPLDVCRHPEAASEAGTRTVGYRAEASTPHVTGLTLQAVMLRKLTNSILRTPQESASNAGNEFSGLTVFEGEMQVVLYIYTLTAGLALKTCRSRVVKVLKGVSMAIYG